MAAEGLGMASTVGNCREKLSVERIFLGSRRITLNIFCCMVGRGNCEIISLLSHVPLFISIYKYINNFCKKGKTIGF